MKTLLIHVCSNFINDGDMQADALKETMENKATTVTVTPHLRSAAYDYAKAIGVKLD